jgi:predicted aspartyl protease
MTWHIDLKTIPGSLRSATVLLPFVFAAAMANIASPLNEHQRMTDGASGGDIVATQRDPYGRVCAPVMINGKGPFSLIVDTGANRSAVTSEVARSLGLSVDESAPMLLHGVTGNARVPSIRIESMSIGALKMAPENLPVVFDAVDGADGFLGLSGLTNRRLVIDLARNRISISPSSSGRVGPGYVRIPAELSRLKMLIVNTRKQGILVKAILDTGAEATIGNLAMQRTLTGQSLIANPPDRIVGTTSDVLFGRTVALPLIELGSLRILGARISYGNLPIFDHFQLSTVPAMLVGMDVLGQFESLAIDYRKAEVQLRPPNSSRR